LHGRTHKLVLPRQTTPRQPPLDTSAFL